MARSLMSHRLVSRIVAFGDPCGVELQQQRLDPAGRKWVRVRITHSSVGSTDVLARRGGYLLHPRPGFIPGYDFVGRLESTNEETKRLRLQEGDRVAGILPRMGAHASHVTVPASVLVAVPDELSSPTAATLPLDAVTADHALRLLAIPAQGSVLIQGVTGPVGMLLAEKAEHAGLRRFGTASARTRHLAESRGVRVFDYTDPEWMEQAWGAVGRFDGSVDHTGIRSLRRVVASTGRIVRLSYVAREGKERRDTLLGGARTILHGAGHPAERLCSIPILVATQRARYRTILAGQFELARTGRLTPPTVRLVPFAQLRDAHHLADHLTAGEKIVLQMGSDED
jgi:NADPH:quinone reductase